MILDYPCGPHVITVLTREKREDPNQRERGNDGSRGQIEKKMLRC